jgi:REP-associated tyrosine transposase
MPVHRKRVKHYDRPGDAHELTFSCYNRLPLLENEAWRAYLAESITVACHQQQFCLAAFVFMPEHVHLLVFPNTKVSKLSAFLAAVKRPCSVRVKQDLVVTRSELLQTLTVRERPGKTAFRFWQEGSGYDRNLFNEAAVIAAIDYLHINPVRRGLCQSATGWAWSSARFYISVPSQQHAGLPTITRLPPGFFSKCDAG